MDRDPGELCVVELCEALEESQDPVCSLRGKSG